LAIADRKSRERAERERRIIAAARTIAEAEGWASVTVRRLAEEIEFSQPVLYTHFENRDAIVAAVAVQGFRDLGASLRRAAALGNGRVDALEKVGAAYLGFARRHPALYHAMFTMPTSLHFAEADTGPELKAAFASLQEVVGGQGGSGTSAAETFWAALHGLAQLEQSGRIKPAGHEERLALLVDMVAGLASAWS
jgi:AcrR family transcriptional regulator